MGLGPVHAATPILQRHGLGLNDLDAWEINEAFAAQVIGCIEAWKTTTTAATTRPARRAGRARRKPLNVDGGAIALGHPVGASGARIVLHLLHVLRRRAAVAASPRSASAAARAAPCWWRHEHRNEPEHWRSNATPMASPGSPSTRADARREHAVREVMRELGLMLDECDAAPPRA
jgi:hypothetical protein